MENFIFIVGCGHSGTTILNKIIGNHRDVYGIPNETFLFSRNHNEIISLVKGYNENKKKINKKYICEKTPRHVYFLDKMYVYTKNPKIIVITRDGRDVVSSIKKRNGNIHFGIDRWINDNHQWLNHKNKDQFHVLKYEDFVKNTKETMIKICQFLEMDYYDEILNYKKEKITLPPDFFNGLIQDEKHDKLRSYQINQDIYDGSNRWIKDLTQEEIQLLYSHKAFLLMMEKLGYDL